jgi:hypothetical protein
LQHAVDAAAPGDTVLVRAGTYAGCVIRRSGAAQAPCALKAAPGEAVLVNAAGPENRRRSNLEVGARGEIRITPGAGAQLCGACRLPGLIVLVLAPYPHERPRARTLHLVLGRDAMGGDAWRRLNRWLRWMQRGQHLAG